MYEAIVEQLLVTELICSNEGKARALADARDEFRAVDQRGP
jgi:hypothetical protein